MANIRLIKHRIKSTQNIAKITRAMEMVAASKMKKAQEAAIRGKLYADKIYELTHALSEKIDISLHPLLSHGNPNGKDLVIIITTNKGLCGGLNTTMFRELHSWFGTSSQTTYITLGKKGEHFVASTGQSLVADFSTANPFLSAVPAVTKLFVDGFIDGTYTHVWVVYSQFINALHQLPVRRQILPISVSDIMGSENVHQKAVMTGSVVVEPGIADMLDHLLPHYLENMVRTAVYQQEASEHSARMIAMKNATDAANDVMEELTLLYNKARQERITYEIADLVTARMAVS